MIQHRKYHSSSPTSPPRYLLRSIYTRYTLHIITKPEEITRSAPAASAASRGLRLRHGPRALRRPDIVVPGGTLVWVSSARTAADSDGDDREEEAMGRAVWRSSRTGRIATGRARQEAVAADRNGNDDEEAVGVRCGGPAARAGLRNPPPTTASATTRRSDAPSCKPAARGGPTSLLRHGTRCSILAAGTPRVGAGLACKPPRSRAPPPATPNASCPPRGWAWAGPCASGENSRWSRRAPFSCFSSHDVVVVCV